MRFIRRAAFAVAVVASAGLFTLATTATASATTLVDQGSTTLDTSTHLQWLDLRETYGLSYNDVSNNVGVSFIAQGWRYATVAELDQLFKDAGGSGTYPEQTDVAGGVPNPTLDAVILLDSLLGGPGLGGPGSTLNATGILADDWSGLSTFKQLGEWNGVDLGFLTIAQLIDNQGGAEFDSHDYSSFLVKSSVAATPIPASLPLFISALGGLGFVGWRRKQASVA